MRMATARPELPVVLVNRHPENSRWLDALELGAADYCGAPFEPTQLRWLVGSILGETGAATAFA
jgi:DNA-binding NtrC family response regulator